MKINPLPKSTTVKFVGLIAALCLGAGVVHEVKAGHPVKQWPSSLLKSTHLLKDSPPVTPTPIPVIERLPDFKWLTVLGPGIMMTYLALRKDVQVSPGTSIDMEVTAYVANDGGVPYIDQLPWRYNGLGDGGAIDPRSLTQYATDNCVGPVQTFCENNPDDAGYQHCLDLNQVACELALHLAPVGIRWKSEPYPTPDGSVLVVQEITRDQMLKACACRSAVDAGGDCLTWSSGADAGTQLSLRTTAQVGTWAGASCRRSPCVETEARDYRGGPGYMLNPECIAAIPPGPDAGGDPCSDPSSHCFDGIFDCDETDVDCGRSCGATCRPLQACDGEIDCIPGASCTNNICLMQAGGPCTSDPECETSTCIDNICSHDDICSPCRTDGDCYNADGAICSNSVCLYPNGHACEDDPKTCEQCVSGFCINGQCNSGGHVGDACTMPSDCMTSVCSDLSWLCVNGNLGDSCGDNSECNSSNPYCDAQGGGGHCSQGNIGDHCDYIGWYQCQSTYCDEWNHVCSTGENGSGCINPWSCQSYVCDDVAHQCVAGNPGDPCSDGSACQSQSCTNNVCD